jgi:hypothetical protein
MEVWRCFRLVREEKVGKETVWVVSALPDRSSEDVSASLESSEVTTSCTSSGSGPWDGEGVFESVAEA